MAGQMSDDIWPTLPVNDTISLLNEGIYNVYSSYICSDSIDDGTLDHDSIHRDDSNQLHNHGGGNCHNHLKL